ncbi:MAG TPA: hypothetical protein VLF39_01635 [Candidatus Saccharimonadales bacterium]|nr:hypothetical protein [Candidatus Saccharimonadales bacterium]
MSKSLSELLGANEPWFSINVTELEKASGNQSIDVRLTAEIATKINRHVIALELDPTQSSSEELYYALMNLVGLHNQFLSKHIGLSDLAKVEEVITKIRLVIERLNIPKQTWALKHSVAKRLLTNNPPQQTMKKLKYRSIDSMLKRESMGLLFGLIRILESEEWLSKFIKTYKKLQPADFEARPIEFIQPAGGRWQAITGDYVRKSHHNLIHSKELGSILILPLPVDQLKGLPMMLMTIILYYINEIRLYGAFLKLKQIEPNFGDMVVKLIADDDTGKLKVGRHTVHWRVVQRHLAHQSKSANHGLFEPYLEASDLAWRKAEEVLYRLEPALMYWHEMDYVGLMVEDRPISFNLMDNAVNYLNNVPYGQQSCHYMRHSLWNELQMRYLSHPALEAQVLKQLDNESRSVSMIAQEIFG